MSAPGDSRKVVFAALGANLLIGIAKFVAAWLSGSAAMLAEGVHSVADTTNQALLLVGMSLAAKDDPRFPLGRAGERYFWGFVVALMLFLGGGVFTIYEGVHKLAEGGGAHDQPLVSVVVLVVSLGIEGVSFFIALREFERSRAGRPFRQALFHGRDPTIPIVLLEDAGAVAGLAIALVSVVAAWTMGSAKADAIGSLCIGVLLCGIGLLLAFETHGLIIGEGATPEMRDRTLSLVRGTPGVEAVTQMLTLHLGPDTILLALKIRFLRGSTIEDVERVTNELEERVRAAVPEMKRIFVEADGQYDQEQDPAYSMRVRR